MEPAERERLERVLIECVPIDEAIKRLLRDREGVWTTEEIAREIGAGLSSVTRWVQRLVATGLVHRGRIQGDRKKIGYLWKG